VDVEKLSAHLLLSRIQNLCEDDRFFPQYTAQPFRLSQVYSLYLLELPLKSTNLAVLIIACLDK
jgi:hypothetical protein